MIKEYKEIKNDIEISRIYLEELNETIFAKNDETTNDLNLLNKSKELLRNKLSKTIKYCEKEFEPTINSVILNCFNVSSIMSYAENLEMFNVENIFEEAEKLINEINKCVNEIANTRVQKQLPFYTRYANAKQKLFYLFNNIDELFKDNYKTDDIENYLVKGLNSNIKNLKEEYEKNIKRNFNSIKNLYSKAKNKESGLIKDIDSSKIRIESNLEKFNNNLLVGLKKEKTLIINNFEDIDTQVSNKMYEEGFFNSLIKEEEIDITPAYIDLKKLINKQGCIYVDIKDIGKDKSQFYDFLMKFILQFISKQPTKMGQVAYVNQYIDKMMVGYLGELSKAIGAVNTFKDVISSDSAISDLIVTLISRINDRIRNYGISENGIETTVFDYNENISDNKQSLVLLVISNYKKNISHTHMEKLKSIIDSGPKAGVFTILINEEQPSQDDYYNSMYGSIISEIESKIAYKLEFKNNNIKLNNEKIKVNMTEQNFSFKDYFYKMKHSTDNIDTKIYLNSLFDNEEYIANKPNAYDGLQIPIGKEGSDIKYLELQSDSPNCHTIITGRTGAGKSVSLHTLILSACYNYSPNEVQFYLIDFKDGVEFSHYQNNLKIPHIKYIALNSNIEDSLDILKSLDAKKVLINEQLKMVGASNICTYNNHVDVINGKLPNIPHTFILIDEFQVMFDGDSDTSAQCIKILQDLAKQSRNVGFHLVLSSQKLPSNNTFNDILSQINTRICFNNDKEIIKDLIPKSFSRVDELEERGRAFFSQGDNNCALIKTAFVDASEQNHGADSGNQIASSINKKYSDYEININIAGQTESRVIDNLDEIICKYKGDEIFSSDIGINYITNEAVNVEFSDDNKYPLVMLGDLVKSKQVETILMANIYSQLKNNFKKFEISYFNLFNPRKKRIKDIAKKYASSNQIEIFDESNSLSKLEEIYKIFKERKSNRGEFYPIFAFISSAERLPELVNEEETNNDDDFGFSFSNIGDSKGSSKIDYKSLIGEGYKYSIFIIPHFETYQTCAHLLGLGSFSDIKLRYLVYDRDELSSDISRVNIKLNFNSNTAVLVKDGAVSKICLYKTKKED